MTDLQQAIETLSHHKEGVFPREALQTVIDQQEAATPLLLDYLETVAADPQGAIDNDQIDLLLFAIFLLAQFRETRAYKPLIKLLNQLDEEIEWIIGEEGLSRILASVCNGDVMPIQQLAENPEANQYARSHAFYSLLTLVCRGQWDKSQLHDYCRRMLSGELQYEGGYLRISLADISEMMMFSDLIDSIRSCYQQWPDMETYITLKEVEDIFEEGEVDEFSLSFHQDYITDTIAELENWDCFTEEGVGEELDDIDLSEFFASPEDVADDIESFFSRAENQGTIVRDAPKVGRNDPCPCGSGKKFKKCCG
nr:DUF1186 domain-containing protein [Endozoicomonas arenosclerae]